MSEHNFPCVTTSRVRSIWNPVDMPRGVDDIAELIYKAGRSKTVLKDDKTTTVTVVDLDDRPNQKLVVKRYNARNRWHHFTRAVRESRASRCWRMSFIYTAAGISVARPFMMHEQRFLVFNQDAFFAAEKLVGQELLSALPKLEHSEQVQVVRAVKTLFNQLTENFLSHGDMKATNILWDGSQLSMIDLDAAEQHSSLHRWRRANAKDRKRFLKNWRDQPEILSLFGFLN